MSVHLFANVTWQRRWAVQGVERVFTNSGATLLTFRPTNVGSAHKQSISQPDMNHASL